MEPIKPAEQMLKQANDFLAARQGQAEPYREVLTGKHARSDVLQGLMQKIESGTANLHDLARGYKHAPHSPVGLLFKYIVHRSNNLDAYNDSNKVGKLDQDFLLSSGTGGAQESHKLVTPEHLNSWLQKNPNLPAEAFSWRDELQKRIANGSTGLNVRKINGEPHVALNRGLDTEWFGPQMALSSFADTPNHEFGRHQFPVWAPVKDLWYGYPAAPAYPQGDNGHENEWLVSNRGPLYVGSAEDVKPSLYTNLSNDFPRLPASMDYLDFLHADDGMLAQMMAEGRLTPEVATDLHNLGKLGPKTLATAIMGGLDPRLLANHPSIPRDMALRLAREATPTFHLPFRNPNLTSQDLKDLIIKEGFLSQEVGRTPDNIDRITAVASHPNFNEDAAEALIDIIHANKNPEEGLAALAKSSSVPLLSLHKALISGLSEHDESGWYPEWAVAKAFSKGDTADAPKAFNNSYNGDRYLRALTEFFRNSPERQSNASNVYEEFLKGARLGDGIVQELVDMSNRGLHLPGVEPQDDHFVADMARENPRLSERQMVILSMSAEGREGLIDRSHGMLPFSVQMAIAYNAEPHEMALSELADRGDLAKEAAETILKRLKDAPVKVAPFTVSPVAIARSLASNSHFPVEMINKFIEHKRPEDQTPFEKGLSVGLEGRQNVTHILQPLPPGGVE